MGSVAPLLLALSFHTCTLCAEDLLGARQLGFLAKSYIVNIVVFLSGLLVVDRLGLGLRAVWNLPSPSRSCDSASSPAGRGRCGCWDAIRELVRVLGLMFSI